MLHEIRVEDKFWKELIQIDEARADEVAAKGCAWCGGRLDRSDYARKPRGGLCVPGCEEDTRRISLCCREEGCRKRATPPSVRFLGRKVYVGAAVVMACSLAQEVSLGAAARVCGMARRTVRRWLDFWQGDYAGSPEFETAGAHFSPPLEKDRVPQSMWQRFAHHAHSAQEGLIRLLRFVGPVTTSSVNSGWVTKHEGTLDF